MTFVRSFWLNKALSDKILRLRSSTKCFPGLRRALRVYDPRSTIVGRGKWGSLFLKRANPILNFLGQFFVTDGTLGRGHLYDVLVKNIDTCFAAQVGIPPPFSFGNGAAMWEWPCALDDRRPWFTANDKQNGAERGREFRERWELRGRPSW